MSTSTTQQRARIALQAATAALTFLPTLLHELTHMLISLPWAERVTISVRVRSADAQAGVDWRKGADEVPGWGIWLAAYGPALIGGLVGIWGVARLVGGGVPQEPRTLLLSGVLAVWWAVYTLPSGDDKSAASRDQS
jgi:hypothetical protein